MTSWLGGQDGKQYYSEAIFKNLRRPRAQHHDHSSNFLAFRTTLDIVYDAVRPGAGSTIPGSFPSQFPLAHISPRSVLVLSISPAYKYAPFVFVEARQRRTVSLYYFFLSRAFSLARRTRRRFRACRAVNSSSGFCGLSVSCCPPRRRPSVLAVVRALTAVASNSLAFARSCQFENVA